MTDILRCHRCQAVLPASASEGLCPKCLLQAGFESQPPSRAPVGGPSSTEARGPGARRPAFELPETEQLSRCFPQFEILELLGQGGMGSVYKARQPSLDRLVAIKILPPEIGRNPSFAERFTREAKALARLNHPHIVTVHDVGCVDGLCYFVMEYVDGVNLRGALRAGSILPAQSLEIVRQICDALQYAHEEGVVHRDIKPENILLDRRGRIKIADFGLAKLLGADRQDVSLTQSEQVLGTLRYMAPEQAHGSKDVDHRADIFSLGVVFYELLTGELPVGRFAPPSQKVQIDVQLDQIVLRALEQEPALRYQHAVDVKTDVESVGKSSARGLPEANRRYLTSRRPSLTPMSEASMRMLLVIAVALVFSLLVVGVGVTLAGLAFLVDDWRSGSFWGWIGGAFGCVFGGLGSLAGTWNTYRQMEGAPDVVRTPQRTWLDRSMTMYGALGLALLAAAATVAANQQLPSLVYPLALFGGIVLFQAVVFGFVRAAWREPK